MSGARVRIVGYQEEHEINGHEGKIVEGDASFANKPLKVIKPLRVCERRLGTLLAWA